MSQRTFFLFGMLTLLFSAVCFLFPEIDLSISHFFYSEKKNHFLLETYYDHFHLNIFRDLLVWISYGFMGIITGMLLLNLTQSHMSFARNKFFSTKTCVFLLLCFLAAPILTVNYALKNHWGRARPHQVHQFGGDKNFTPAWVISNQCETNCSFTSGETANVFCYLALLFVMQRKRLITTLILTIGTLIVFERIAQGDHFFSDTILSAFIDYLLIWIIYRALNFNNDMTGKLI